MLNIKSLLYVRKYKSSQFVKIENCNPEELPFLLIKTDAVKKTSKYFCKEHVKWENVVEVKDNEIKLSCGTVLKGIPVEFPVNPNISEKNLSYCRANLEKSKIKTQWKNDYSASFLQEFYCESKKVEDLETYFSNFYDEDSIEKDLLLFRLIVNEEKCILNVESYYLNRERLEKNQNELVNCINYWKIPFKKIFCFCKLKERRFAEISRRHNKKLNLLPKKLPDEALATIKGVLNSWAGREITLKTCLHGKEFLEAITACPFEPNLWAISQNFPTVIINQNDSDIYNHFTSAIGLKSYSSLRKMYYEDPMVLVKAKKLQNIGYSDVNIINKILQSPESEILTWKSDLNNKILEFLKLAVKEKGQKEAWNLVNKNQINSFIFEDGIRMFLDSYSKLPSAVKEAVFKDGFTGYNHDVLAKITNELANQNVEFEITDYQKSLEDEIEGYSFRLPKDSDTLREIGSSLHNCVASYKNKILKGESIVLFVQKGGQYKLCIEIYKGVIWQERGDYNKNPSSEEKRILKIWHQNHKLTK